MEYLPSLLIGLAGSACSWETFGGSVLSLSLRNQGRIQRLMALILYSAGHVFTYIFLGAFAGMAGRTLLEGGVLTSAHAGILFCAGLMMLLVSLEMMGFPTRLHLLHHFPGETTIERIAAHYRERFGELTPFYLGLFNGFLPRPLVYAGLAFAFASGNAINGMYTMACFSMGMLPILWLVGTSGFLISPTMRSRLIHAMAIIVLGVGCIMVWRALPLHAEGNPQVTTEMSEMALTPSP
ncbi:MAG TPA: sulfite exporter TauE/SafE family protein [bacterium]|nr:sulfite exporter TauE/SafE family protein [bacterium]HQO33948.1 sulfite exporter TauE/SafE family protein [bacterium]HQP99728.1 sulfite exporter TauE/SafE family protein [bacterium]